MDNKGVAELTDQDLIWQDLYMKGDDLQKISVIQALPKLLKTDNNATVTRIIPKIQQELPNSSSEFHIVTSKIFKLLMEMNLPINLLRPVLQGIESQDPIVSNAWIETLLAVIPNLSDASIRKEVLPVAITMSQLNRAVYYRITSCKLLGIISINPKLTPFDVKKDILPLVQSLSQDCFYEVRAAMCLELPKIAQGLGSDNLVKSSLMPCLVELSNDDNVSVRAASVDAAVLMIPYLNQEAIRATTIPLVKQLCVQSSKQGDATFPGIARVYGMLVNNLQNHLTNVECVWFLNFFMQLSKRGLTISPAEFDADPGLGVTCREFCAFNLPAVTYFTIRKIPSELNIWYSIFKALAGDPCYLVRKTIAGCIHEITRILGEENKCIMMDFVKLLRDDSEEVLDSLVPNIGMSLELFCMSNILSREVITESTMEIGRGLLKCQSELFRFHNWRRNMAFLIQLERLPNCMASDFIHQHFTSVILKLTVEARPRPLRSQAARTILVFLRYNIKENHRKWIREKLYSILGNATCCYTRHIFVSMCIAAMDIFSNKYFKEHFFSSLIKLTEDPVSTIRICVVKLCPTMKRMLVFPIDRNLQMKLENALSKMEALETDKDVLDTLKCKLKDMRAPQVNKQETLFEEKRKVEEEDKIQQGKIVPCPRYPVPSLSRQPKGSPSRSASALEISKTAKKIATPATTSDMSFLGQHFYIDAGITLPENISANKTLTKDIDGIEANLKALEINNFEKTEMAKEVVVDDLVISTVSVENTNVENMSDEDLKELETSTTNITDDVKVNIQKKCSSKGTPKSKLPTDTVKRRNKRYSCILPSDHGQATGNSKVLKRRSLNIGPQELSKIPICFKTKLEEKTNMKRSKSGSVQSISSMPYSSCSNGNIPNKKNIHSKLKLPSKTENNDVPNKVRTRENLADNGNISSNNDSCKVDNKESNNKIEIKENVPVGNDSIKRNVPNKCTKENVIAKVSNLPVLVRRTQSEVRK